MDIWLFLLIFFAIVIGWALGRLQRSRDKRSDETTDLFSESYARGLNYLLTDDADRAVEVFTDLIAVNKNTIEIHIALGNLFRSKGEVDRAIKMHQNLLARPALTRKQRHMAITELADDYLKAGLLDRAEKLYREMISLNANVLQAYRRLLELYIAEKSWVEAVGCAEMLYRLKEPDAHVAYAQCLCEIAEEAMASGGNHRLVRKNLDRAIEIDQSCVRAGLLLIQLHLITGSVSIAKKALQRLVKKNPEFMSLYIAPARQIYLERENRVYLDFLETQYQQYPSTRLAMALLEYYAHDDQIEKAREFLRTILNHNPSFEAFEFALRFLRSDPDQLTETWGTLSIFLKALQDKKIQYMCTRCGYESHTIQWLCPSCRNWASMKSV